MVIIINQNETNSNNMLLTYAENHSKKISNELNSTSPELIFAKVGGLPSLLATIHVSWQLMVQSCLFFLPLFRL